MKRFFSILIFLNICAVSLATHNRAGQIVFTHVPGTLYTYDFVHTQFYWTPSTAWQSRTSLAISFGDGTTGRIQRVDLGPPSVCEDLPDEYTKCEYRTRHTFPGPGVYVIVVEDPNRNFGVENIPNSVSVVFSVVTTLRIDLNTGHNSAPRIERYPTDKAAVGRRFVHNPSAVHDRDSLSYALVICTRERGVEIETYSFPETSDELYVDEITGDFVWDAPVKAGIYNVAMRIDQWHHRHRHVRVGSIVRDMQIEVVETDNEPPEILPPDDICVVAGELISVDIEAVDYNENDDGEYDFILLTATGYPFSVRESKADTVTVLRERGKTILRFTWQTQPSHVRQQPYTVFLKAEDDNSDVRLAAFEQFNIRVIAPPVEITTVRPDRKEILIEWTPSVSEDPNHQIVAGYEIWRRICLDQAIIDDETVWCEDFELDECDTGVPAGYGYERVGFVEGHVYWDNDNGRGLSPGITYCYRIVTLFHDQARSIPSLDGDGLSKDVCATLEAGTPPMIHASVETVSPTAGKIFVEWLEAPFLDKLKDDYTNPDNYKYRLYFSTNPEVVRGDDDWVFLQEFNLLAAGGKTSFEHTGLNTRDDFPYYYKVVLIDKDGKPVDELNGMPVDNEIASTLYPVLTPSDQRVSISFGRYAPWVNREYDIYRCEGNDCIPDINSNPINETPVRGELFIDTGLTNNQEYCYIVVSRGVRIIDGTEYTNENWSHLACVTPIDNVPPCPPSDFYHTFDCTERDATLEWVYTPSCDEYMVDDLKEFRIYFTGNPDATHYNEFSLKDVVERVGVQMFYSYVDEGVTRGCYFITSIDDAGNESDKAEAYMMRVCFNCGSINDGSYSIPNVFTPNDDGINDYLFADIDGACYCTTPNSTCLGIEGSAVTRVNMEIFNRVGKLVFKTDEPCINWDGRDMDTKQKVPSGVYFYICDVYEMRDGIEVLVDGSPLAGYIHVYSDGSGVPSN